MPFQGDILEGEPAIVSRCVGIDKGGGEECMKAREQERQIG